MKKIYSVILLLTFLVGTLQPIMPMIEYQLFEGNVIELLGDASCNSQESYAMIECATNADCPSCDENQKLLDTDFYPLAVVIATIQDPSAFLIGIRFDLPIIDKITSPTILPIPPPPWLS